MRGDDFGVAATLSRDFPKDELFRGFATMLVACATRYAAILRAHYLEEGGLRDTQLVMTKATEQAFVTIVEDNLVEVSLMGNAEGEAIDFDNWRSVFTSRMLTQWKVAQAVDRQTPADVGIDELVDPILEAWGIERPIELGDPIVDLFEEVQGGQYL